MHNLKLLIYLFVFILGVCVANAGISVDIETAGIAGIYTSGDIEIAVGGASITNVETASDNMDVAVGAVYTESFATSTTTTTTTTTTLAKEPAPVNVTETHGLEWVKLTWARTVHENYTLIKKGVWKIINASANCTLTVENGIIVNYSALC